MTYSEILARLKDDALHLVRQLESSEAVADHLRDSLNRLDRWQTVTRERLEACNETITHLRERLEDEDDGEAWKNA